VAQDQLSTYKAALKEAREAFDKAHLRVQEIEIEEFELKSEMARLRRTITALAAMCSESPYLDDMGITEYCAEIMDEEQGEVTTADVVAKLQNMGFDLGSQKNPSASVHAILNRLSKSGKITKVTDDQNKVTWRGPHYDPDYVPEVPF